MATAFSPKPRALRLRWRSALTTGVLATLLGCAAPVVLPSGWPESLAQLLPADVVLLGEQHDDPAHQAMERTAVQWLAARGRLSAVVIEMAEAGHTTADLAPGANEAAVRAALAWDERVWPWRTYAGPVMAAVHAGVPVRGGNLPRSAMASTMQDATLDTVLAPAAHAAQWQAVRVGHCNLLPETQLPGMVRIQIARDQSMARVALAAPRGPGQTTLLIAGGGHVLRSRGVPAHLPENISFKVALWQSGHTISAIESEANITLTTAERPPQDLCASLRTLSTAANR